jgi:hypothetical protein
MKYDKERWPDVDHGLYELNRRKIPPEDLLPYAGQQVAFNGHGTEIIASAPDEVELMAKLDAMGVPQSAVVISWIDDFS